MIGQQGLLFLSILCLYLMDIYLLFILSTRTTLEISQDLFLLICELFQIQMGPSFPFLRANNICQYLLNIRARSFYSLVRRGYHTQGQCTIGTDFFSRVCSTDSSSCSERKNWKKKRLKQGRKTKEGNQNVVVVANSPGSSSLYCRTAIAPLSPRYCYAVTLLSLRCHNAIAPL